MLQSMTGYGKTEISINDKIYTIEIKTLNGKNTEINLKLSTLWKPLDYEIKSLLQQSLLRGSIEFAVYTSSTTSSHFQINIPLAKEYHEQIKKMCLELNIQANNIVETLLNMPEITNSNSPVALTEENKKEMFNSMQTTIQDVLAFRKREGNILEQDITLRIKRIQQYKDDLLLYQNERTDSVKMNLEQKLQQLSAAYDKDRFEQELIYYLEKLDFTEEVTRLNAHCDYFLTLLSDETEIMKGKKMNFIAQEIGREINTLGSKAQHAGIQKIVIMMKDEMEKIKEQINNVL